MSRLDQIEQAPDWEKQKEWMLQWVRDIKAFLDCVHSYKPSKPGLTLASVKLAAEHLESEIQQLGW